MITLYNMKTSPNGLKIRMLLEEAGLPYREVALRGDAGENRRPEYLCISPAGTVPAITDDETGASVFESTAVLIYLAERAGRFLPQAQPARADVLKWLIFEAVNVEPPCENIYLLSYRDDAFIEEGLAFQREKLRRSVAPLEAQLAGNEYLAGECSVADFALFPIMTMFEDFAETPLGDFPNLDRWVQIMRQRPGVQRALARRTE